ncbi:MAG: hypothetical protein V3S48_02175 [Candidatus Neomarinimicrobiota bacterium]
MEIVFGQSYRIHVHNFSIAEAALVWKEAGQVELSYNTVGPADLIWNQHNYYKTSFDSLTFGLKNFKKNIKQSNFNQKIEIKYQDGTLNYDEKFLPREKNIKTIFTLMSLLRNEAAHSLDGINYLLDHEGKLFDARFLWSDTTRLTSENILCDWYRLDLKQAVQSDSFYEDTDTFMEYVAKTDLVRQIWVERFGNRRIIKALIIVHGLPFEAVIINE